jgi:hypothetical protein
MCTLARSFLFASTGRVHSSHTPIPKSCRHGKPSEAWSNEFGSKALRIGLHLWLLGERRRRIIGCVASARL